MLFTFSQWCVCVCVDVKSDFYRSQTTRAGSSFSLKDDRDKKPRLTFMFPILSGQNRKGEGSKPAFDLYSNEKYTREIGFLFHFREWISWWQIVLYHLVALISRSEHQELFFITKTWRNFYTSSPQNAMTISISAPVFKQYPQGHLRHFSAVLIYTWKAITYQRSSALNSRKTCLCLCPLCQRIRLILHLKARQPEDDPRCNWVQRIYILMKNSTTYTTVLIRLQCLMGENVIHCWIQRGDTLH